MGSVHAVKETNRDKDRRPLVVSLDALEGVDLEIHPKTGRRPAIERLHNRLTAWRVARTPEAAATASRNLWNFLEDERDRGRKLILLSDPDVSDNLSKNPRLQIFGETLSRSNQDLARLQAATSGDGFDYLGGERDFEIRRQAYTNFFVDPVTGTVHAAAGQDPTARALESRHSKIRLYLKALRIHQWIKNFLIFVPAVAAHEVTGYLAGILAFLSFGLMASSIYIVNDLLDLASDRQHPRKRNRAFAAGHISIAQGYAMVPLLLGSAILLGCFLPQAFTVVLGVYYALALAYAFILKRKPMIDVVVLAGFYGIRLAAGGAAMAVPISPWLMAFAIFGFLSLALVKRTTELMTYLESNKNPAGRGYVLRDLPILQSLAGTSGFVAVLVFALYINSPAVTLHYAHPEWLWGVCVLLIYWLGRVLLIANRGTMHDDPVVFAATDRVSLVTAALVGVLLLVSL